MFKYLILGLLSATSASAQALFISPVGGPENYGDVVIPSDPRLVIVADEAADRPIAVFSIDDGLSVVLQPELPDDGDVHPVGYFQATWRADTPGRFTALILLPDGREVGRLAMVFAETRRALRKLDLAGAWGGVLGGTTKLRFRIDAPTVDGDGDGVLDWHDNCPEVANADQADRNEDGAGDACAPDPCNDRGPGFEFDPVTGACQCAEVFDCVPPAVFDEDTCVCACPACGDGHVLLDEATCACGCPQLAAPNPCGGAPNLVLNPQTCACECPVDRMACPAGMVVDAERCSCVCDASVCGEGQVQDPNTCACMCPQVAEGHINPCGDQPNLVLNPQTCACECPVDRMACPAGMVVDAKSCGCVCDAALCGKTQVQDPDTCACACPQVLAGIIDLCADQPNQVFNPQTCACECPVDRMACPPDHVLNPDACQCEPEPCGPGLVRTRQGTCECPGQIQCPFGQVLDPVKCTCSCGPVLCGEGQVVNAESCGCECATTLPCREHEVFDPNTCACEQVPQ
jgi:hypothetical protein